MAKTILIIIEKDIFLGDAMVRRFQDENYQAELVSNGSQGLKKIRDEKPDLVILDADLPGMSGEDILSAKLKDPAIAGIPTIILTNSDEPEEISRVLGLGAKDFVIKSEFDPEILLNKVKQQISKKGPFPDVAAVSAVPAADSVSAASRAKKLSQASLLANKKIMWVEDDAFLSEIIARKLSTQGCVLLHAGTGEEALPLIEKEVPDVILLDILLPGIDGFEILQRIKSNASAAIKRIPVILLSNLGQKSDIEKGEKLGAEIFLIKATVSLDEIVTEICRVIEKFDKSAKK